MDRTLGFIIAVDFDGTLCENCWPDIGAPKEHVISYITRMKASGAKIILWTNRVGDNLAEAVKWCSKHGLEFDAVNENLPQVKEYFGCESRKIFATLYIDDRAIPPSDLTVN